jgi:hypothetical protein
MAALKDPAEHALVVKAITCRVGGCCEWDMKAERRFLSRPPLPNLTPEGVIDELIDFIASGGDVVQVEEQRPEYDDRPFYYKVILPMAEFRLGLFVEIILHDDDPDVPMVRIVNWHEQGR